MNKVREEEMGEVLSSFDFIGEVTAVRPYGSGHINDTFLVTFEIGKMGRLQVILQRLNSDIFLKPVEVIKNIEGVTSYMNKIIRERGGDPFRETLNLIPTKEGEVYYVDSLGYYWRAYIFITDVTSFDAVESEEDFYQSGYAFGRFQNVLAGYSAETLAETIVGFHDTELRLQHFKDALAADIKNRAQEVSTECEFILSREALAKELKGYQTQGEIPLRVTHNDTKLNNIMIDNRTGKGICVIDLDTVMPGLAVNDFGDSIRFGANTGAEDERDLSKVSCDLELFKVYAKGYLEGANGGLTARECELLPLGARTMTFECGMRFLTDYLNGDTYFKTQRSGQNLDRARTQFKLLQDMEDKSSEMEKIISELKG
ncbi:hypothetical protein M2146_000403 [Lachnospiraceae bacterium PF1-22]|uniref:phosphotransferase enzyme family protein n=1 Tax=Ohessyouella blattaphilus TaxID=2949333 RepID=UPI003E191273